MQRIFTIGIDVFFDHVKGLDSNFKKGVKMKPKYFEVILSAYFYMKKYNVWHFLNTKHFGRTFVDN